MINKDMDYKEKILEKVEERIKNKIEPDPNFTTERTNMGYWLEYLYDIAFLAGEMSGIRAAKNIMEADQHELDNILQFANDRKKTFQ